MNHDKTSRRGFLRHAARLALAAPALALAKPTLASLPGARQLAFKHTHTGEAVSLVYAVGQDYVPGALNTLNRFLRDHYSGEVGNIDPRLYDLLYRLQQELECDTAFQVISAYRCPLTNARLRQTGGGGVAKRSLHMDGRAIDIRLASIPLADLRAAALAQRAGGVGFYPRDNFVHVDTGTVRRW